MFDAVFVANTKNCFKLCADNFPFVICIDIQYSMRVLPLLTIDDATIRASISYRLLYYVFRFAFELTTNKWQPISVVERASKKCCVLHIIIIKRICYPHMWTHEQREKERGYTEFMWVFSISRMHAWKENKRPKDNKKNQIDKKRQKREKTHIRTQTKRRLAEATIEINVCT